jgi:cell pole-organizing protein PopZ
MEEIIASISRVIAEDSSATGVMRPLRSARSEILELTEAVEPDGSVRHLAPGAATSAAAGLGESSTSAVTSRNDPEPPSAHAGVVPQSNRSGERILSSETSGAAATAFARLGAVSREARAEGELAIGAGDRTLEEIVRETLRPLMSAWLDRHLPGLVERLVREEIARVVGEAGLR